MKHKGGHWLVLEECIVHTAVCQKGTSRAEAVKNQARIDSYYQVTLVWMQLVGNILLNNFFKII